MNSLAYSDPWGDGKSQIAAAAVLNWVRSRDDAIAVPADWVPGATSNELAWLGALGELVGAALSVGSVPAPDFDEGNLHQWTSASQSVDPETVTAFTALLEGNAEQKLAALYSQIVSGPSRRTLGTFFTPGEEADWMVRRWKSLFPSPNSVVDVGAGVGIFSSRAAEAWPEADVFAVDINPVTLGLLALCAQLRRAGSNGLPQNSRIVAVEADFTRWIDQRWEDISGPRLILGNPPYTRLQLMPPADRKRLTASAGGLVGGRAALSAVITAQSLLALGRSDGMALLLPAHWLDAAYATGLRRYLWEQLHRRIELRVFQEQLFADATVDAVALLVGPEESTPQSLTVSRSGKAHTAFQRDPADPNGFERLVSAARARTAPALTEEPVPLMTFLKVRRGVATGANKFFILDEAAVDLNKLGADVLTPLLRKMKSAPDVLTELSFRNLPDKDRRWLLTVRQEQLAANAALREYIEAGESAGLNLGHLCQLRADWFDLHHDLSMPDVVIGQSSKSEFRIIENPLHAAIANNLYGMRWSHSTTLAQREAIVGWLRGEDGQEMLRSVARVQATGLLKIEPRALASLGIPKSVWDRAADDATFKEPVR